jgi:hypothetical protein
VRVACSGEDLLWPELRDPPRRVAGWTIRVCALSILALRLWRDASAALYATVLQLLLRMPLNKETQIARDIRVSVGGNCASANRDLLATTPQASRHAIVTP